MSHKKLFICFFLSTSLEAFISAIWLGSLPAEAGNALAFGYSFQRLILMGGMILLGLSILAGVWVKRKPLSSPTHLERIFDNEWVGIAACLILVIAWVLCFSPAYQWGRFAGYKDRLLPAIIWLLAASMQTCLLWIYLRKQKWPGSFRRVLSGEPELLKGWTAALGVLTIGLVIVAVFRIGLIPDIVYWNDTNVPLLGGQIIGIITVSLVFLGFLSRAGFFADENRNWAKRILPDVLICLFIWGLAVVCWTKTTMPHSYFAPGPYPPNNEMYPFSDAAGYDRSAQLAVIGEGLGTNTYVDKPVYVAFLTAIHLLVGDRMDTVVGLQVAIMALLPALIYLLGRKIHSRLAGLMAAGFLIFREINNIQSTLWVLSTNSHVLLSESLVTLLLALFVLMLTGWVRNTRNPLYLIAAGGALGLASLVRLNPLLLMPVTVVIIWLVCGKRWKKGLMYSLIFAAMFLGTLTPWMLQSYDRHGKFLFFASTLQGVVLDQRTFYSLINNPAPVITPNPGGSSIQTTPEPSVSDQPASKTWSRISGISRYVSAHFFHNMIGATALFPTSLTLDSLEKTIKAPNSYWSADWNGGLSPGQMILMVLVLAVLAFGIAAGWSRNRWAGLMSAGFLVAYSLASAAARTSGGRYILPADWVFMLYFAIGLSQIVVLINSWLHGNTMQPALTTQAISTESIHSTWQIGVVICLFILIGATPAILDRVIPRRFQTVDKQTLVAELGEQLKIDSLGITKSELELFLQSPNAVVYSGKGLYPRYYTQNRGEPDRFSPMRGQAFPRLVMDVIGPFGVSSGVLPLLKSPDALPNGSEILAFGCRGELNDDWLALVIGDVNKHIILRSPAASWSCPAALPVCDDNRVCQ